MITELVAKEFEELKAHLKCDDISAAILVLANIIHGKGMMDMESGEHIGHGIACGLRAVLKDSTVRVRSAD